MKYLVLSVGLLVAAGVATYARYESLNPCVWIEQDMVRQTGLPLLVVQAQVRAKFLLDGVTEPDPATCLPAWWEFKVEGLEEEAAS